MMNTEAGRKGLIVIALIAAASFALSFMVSTTSLWLAEFIGVARISLGLITLATSIVLLVVPKPED